MSSAKHQGTPDACRECWPLPIDFDGRQEAIWQHAIAQFVDQSGVDVTGLSRADLVPLVKSWGQANTVTTLERRLFDEEPPVPAARRHPVDRLAAFLLLAVFVCLSLICTGVWRFLS